MPLINISQNVKQVAYTAAIAGVAAGVLSKFWLGLGGAIKFNGGSYDPTLALGLVVGASSFAGEFAGAYLLPYIPRFNMIAGIESDVINPACTGLITQQTMKMWGDAVEYQAVGPTNLFILGAGSHLVSRKFAGSLRMII
jgi:hypothetical protein